MYFCVFGGEIVDWLVSDEDVILCDWCHMLFCIQLSREIIQLYWIRNKNDIIKLYTNFSLNDWTISDFTNRKGFSILQIFSIFTKTSLAKFDVYFFKHFTGTIPGDVPHRSSHLFLALRYRQFLHIAFVHDVDKNRGTLANSEPQTLWLPIKHSLKFRQCYKYH